MRSSDEVRAILAIEAPAIDWQDACAVVTHERIADAARVAGFGRVRVSSPGLPALIASIESFA